MGRHWACMSLLSLRVFALLSLYLFFFFFQAEDGIRDLIVTGVQTCALPISISGIHRGVVRALEYAKAIAPEHVTALYINIDEETTKKLREKWHQLGGGVEDRKSVV